MDDRLKDKLTSRQVSYAKRGMGTALVAASFWGLNGILLGIVFLMAPFSTAAGVYAPSLVQAAVHDGFGCLWVFLKNIWSGKWIEYLRVLNTRPGKIICLGAVCGGPLAMSGYVLGINLAGAPYALPISALCPCVGTILAAIFLKERIVPRVWLGIVLSIVGAVIVSYTPPSDEVYPHFYLGIGLSLVATFGWGLEGVLSTYGMDLVDSSVAAGLKYLTSFVVYLAAVLPLFAAFPFMFELFLEGRTMLLLGATAMTGAASFFLWYKALNMTGVSRTMALDTTYVLWGMLYTWLFSKLGAVEFEFTPTLVIGALIIVAGVTLVVANPKEMLKMRNV